MPSDIKTPAYFMIYKDTVMIAIANENPIAIEITSRDIADSFMAYFNEFWKLSKPFKENEIISRYKIRKAKIKDAKEISRILTETIKFVNNDDYNSNQITAWQKFNTKQKQKQLLSNPDKDIFVIQKNNNIRGVCTISLKERKMTSLYIDHKYQGRGYGKALLKYIEKFAKKNGINTIVADSSITALEFYKRNGYKIIKKKYLKAGKTKIPCIHIEKKL